ncbi:hypothetical protein [Nocardioides sp. KR10-350]|uniref:hypothetical protein n=1 Tax=Nocardioides cheoyonin TaxID=3156615 RepID=UPI0032B3B612
MGTRLLEGLVWWAALLAAYIFLVSPLTWDEWVLGAVLSAVVSAAAIVATEGFRPPAPPRLRWWHLVRLPVDLVRDTGVLARGLVARRRHVGRSGTVTLPEGDSRGVRAYADLLLSSTPGSYVFDVRPGEGRPGSVRVHRIGGRAGVERVVED